jgi:Ca2+-binding EF-hand superfamily protein
MIARLLVIAALVGLVLGTSAAEDEPKSPAPAARDVQDVVFFANDRPVLIRLHVRVDGKPFPEVFRAATGEYVKRLFTHLDRNGDGVLSEAEARHCPPPLFPLPGVSGGQAGEVHVAFNFAALDANGDGKVTRAELADYFREYNGGAFHVQVRPTPAPPAAARNNGLFTLLDRNKDGKLSRKELAAAVKLLGRLDEDDDEMLTVAELLPDLFPATNEEVVFGQPAPAPASREEDAFYILVPEDSADVLAEMILKRYGPPAERLRDKQLRRKDIALDRATFNHLDRNKDGRLDAAELEKFADRPADIELLIRLGSRSRGEAVLEVLRPTEGGPLAGSVRRVRDGEVVLLLGDALIELRCNPAGLDKGFVAAMRERYLRQFRDADADQNGWLDRQEARESRFFRDVFARLDRDGDGKLTRKEMLDYLDRVQALQARAMGSRVSLLISDAGQGLFDLLDKNRDGRLGLRELRGAPGLLRVLDPKGAGQVAREQIPRSYQLALGLGQASFQRGRGERAVVTPNGNLAYPGDSQPGGPLWFRKMDRNGDGDVSPREFLGAQEDFKRLDTDGDGLISVEEAERAEDLRKKGKGGS